MPPSTGVQVTLGGRQRTLRYTMRALDRLETQTGLAQSQIQTRVNVGSVRYVIWLIWAGLLHEVPDLDRETVIDWLDALTDEEAQGIEEALSSALSESQGQETDDADPEGNDQAAG